MQKYDMALKPLLQTSGLFVLECLAGLRLARWLNVELPEVQTGHLDLLAESETGELIHFELQSTNNPNSVGVAPKTWKDVGVRRRIDRGYLTPPELAFLLIDGGVPFRRRG
jgi:hypothetical protein